VEGEHGPVFAARRELLRIDVQGHHHSSETETQGPRGDQENAIGRCRNALQHAAERKQEHRQQVRDHSCLQDALEGPAAGHVRTEAGSENGENNLGDKHHPITGGAETVALWTREDGTGGRKCNKRQPLDQPCRVDQADLGALWHERAYAKRPVICSPTRIAFAMAVRDGFTAPMLTKKLVSTTYRLSSSCALQFTSSTEVLGSAPN